MLYKLDRIWSLTTSLTRFATTVPVTHYALDTMAFCLLFKKSKLLLRAFALAVTRL